MNADALIAELGRAGIELYLEGAELRFRGPRGALAPELRARIGEQRGAVIAALRARAGASFPLSQGQQAIWLMQHAVPESIASNLAVAVRLRGGVDVAGVRRAAQILVDRHPALRATFAADATGTLAQTIAGAATIELREIDARAFTADGLCDALAEERDRPFDLACGPAFRVAVLARPDGELICLLMAHHIVADGLSMILLLIEMLRALDEGFADPLAAIAPPGARAGYADFVAAEAAALAGPEGARTLDYWTRRLAAPLGRAAVPADRPRPAVPSHRGGSAPLRIAAPTLAAARALARDAGTTPFVVLLAAFKMLLAREAGELDVIVGTPVAAARETRFMRVVGDFVNVVPIRTTLRWSTSFREALALVKAGTLEAIDARLQPLAAIAERLRPPCEPGSFPFFAALFTYQQFDPIRDMAALAAGYGRGLRGAQIEALPCHVPIQAGQTDLTLTLTDTGDGLSGSLNHATDLFDTATARRLADAYVALLQALLADPDEALLPAAERTRILEAFNATAVALDPRPLPAQWQEAAAAAPDRIAARCGGAAVTAGALERRANRLAHHLRARGAGRGTLVGVAGARSIELIVALLAVQKSGAAYVPLDADFPAERLAFMARDSGIGILVAEGGAPGWMPAAVALVDPRAEAAAIAACAATPPDDAPAAHDLAYVIYTSGSTGRPNGVAIGHDALANFLGAMRRAPGLRAGGVLVAVTTISFDIAALELYLPLLAGAVIELAPRDTAADGTALARLLADARATAMQATPTSWRLLLEAGWQPPAGFAVLCGGEPLPADLAHALHARGVAPWNLYGPTETTIWSTGGEVLPGEEIHVGRPIANTRVYLLDALEAPVPVGVPGAIWIGGAGVAIGYHHRPELTGGRFRPDPFAPGGRMYRTGDLARWTSDGRIVHLGREDDQVKLRGWRIEPGEIEAALAAHEDVARAVIAVRGAADDRRLIAYIVPAPGGEVLSSQLRGHLRRTLPDYMIPSLFVEIEAVPLTPNGKVDRAALPDPLARRGRERRHTEPEPGLETTLARIWERVLGIGQVGADDNFFEVGGHSLLSLRVAAQLRQETGLELPMRSLFFQTLREVAATLAADAPQPRAQGA